jgi:hypothetical protein
MNHELSQIVILSDAKNLDGSSSMRTVTREEYVFDREDDLKQFASGRVRLG